MYDYGVITETVFVRFDILEVDNIYFRDNRLIKLTLDLSYFNSPGFRFTGSYLQGNIVYYLTVD